MRDHSRGFPYIYLCRCMCTPFIVSTYIYTICADMFPPFMRSFPQCDTVEYSVKQNPPFVFQPASQPERRIPMGGDPACRMLADGEGLFTSVLAHGWLQVQNGGVLFKPEPSASPAVGPQPQHANLPPMTRAELRQDPTCPPSWSPHTPGRRVRWEDWRTQNTASQMESEGGPRGRSAGSPVGPGQPQGGG